MAVSRIGRVIRLMCSILALGSLDSRFWAFLAWKKLIRCSK
jgi:hypothetical protein